jgi:hypothetical protein
MKIENGKLYVGRTEPLDRVNGGDCPFCGKPVYMAEGQIVKTFNGHPTHKACRK